MLERRSILLAVLACSSAFASDTRFGYGASAAAGYDSNPLLESGGGAGGAFTQVVLDGSMNHALNPRLALFASGFGRARLYETGVEDADSESGSLRAGVGFVPRFLGGRLALAAGAQGAFSSSTFIDRATGGVYEVSAPPSAGPDTVVRIGDRFDFRSHGAFADLRFGQNRRVRWSLDTAWEQTRYTEDYSTTAGLAPLDFRSFSVEPGVALTLNDVATLEASVAWSDLDYDERLALDALGAEVPDVVREYRQTRLTAALLVKPRGRWNFRVGLSGDDRQDTYAGYYDYESWSSFVSVDRDLTRRSSLRLYGSWRELDYQRATLPSEPDTLRANAVRTMLARYEHGIDERLRWFADLGTQSNDSTDPVFACDQEWLMTGIQFRR